MDLALDLITHDLVLTSGELERVGLDSDDVSDEAAQEAKILLSTQQGEDDDDTDFGIPYVEEVFHKGATDEAIIARVRAKLEELPLVDKAPTGKITRGADRTATLAVDIIPGGTITTEI